MWCWVALLYGVFWISSSTALIWSPIAMRCETERVGPLKTFQASSIAAVTGPDTALAIASPRGHGRAASKASLLPHGADAFGLEALDRVQDHRPRASRVR